ncbi:MAG: tetratricopeptide repeat protein [Gammaproteobacteria bacterium]|nr:MAG: tetratricopeptide repeat protein [Gammaproteobacteria bacterium]
MPFLDELKRRNVIKVAMLYVVASWLLLQVADVLFEAMELPSSGLRLVLALLILGFPLALIFSWVFEMTPEGLKRERDIDRSASVTAHTGRKINVLIIVLLVLAIGVVVVDRLIPEAPAPAEPVMESAEPEATADPSALVAEKFAPPPDRSIAVLPFVNMSGDEENEYFADGLSEEILNFLAGVPDLQVTARTSSFQFKDKTADLREVGSALNVAHLLEGSVRRAGDRARITAQLIRTSDGYHLWSESYDRTLEDVFEVQTDIAESVTRALGVVMDEAQRQRMLAAGVRDVEAFIAFQKGRAMYIQAHSNEVDMGMLAESAEWLTKAIGLEPRFASAYFIRSDFYAHSTTTYEATDEQRQAAYASYLRDLSAASEYTSDPGERALIEVDRTLASTNWRSLPDRFETALESSSCADPVWLEVAPAFGFAAQSLVYRNRLIECDPLNFYNFYSAAQAAMWAGKPDEALALVHRGLEIEPDNPFLRALLVGALIALNRPQEAYDTAASTTAWNRDTMLVSASVAIGDMGQARKQVDIALDGISPWLKRYIAIELYAIVGDREAANEAAAWVDALPAGQTMLAAATMECMCGAPFDLEATPVFRQRLEEAGFDWPPPTVIRNPPQP